MKLSAAVSVAALAAGVVSAEESREVVTVIVTGLEKSTQRYGRFDKISRSTELTSSGTRRYGRFDKISRTLSTTSSGQRTYGRFDNTQEPLTTTLYVPAGNGSASGNVTQRPSSNGGAANLGSTGIAIGVAGALAAALLLV